MWQRPRIDVIPVNAGPAWAPGCSSALGAMASASAHSLDCMQRRATCIATKLDEQAVSKTMHGPRIANTYDRRAPAAEYEIPVRSYGPGTLGRYYWASMFIIPVKFPVSESTSVERRSARRCNAS